MNLRQSKLALKISLPILFLSLAAFKIQTASPEKGKWIWLFNGKSLDGWHSYNQDKVVGWRIEDGMLTTDGSGGDLTTNNEYGDFDLRFEFKIPPASNTGVFYKVLETPEIKRTVHSAPEYQIIDDTGYVVRNAKGEQIPLLDTQKSGANYDLHPPLDKTAYRPAGTWNKGRIIVQGSHVQHYLNGKLVADYQYGDAEWQRMVQESKFKDWPYATPRHRGKIALQSHNAKETMWFRKIRIREL